MLVVIGMTTEEQMKDVQNWDTTVALAFAAEQSFAAAQLLTSDTATPTDALKLCYSKYVSALLVHSHFLPPGITENLEASQSNYVRAQEAGISTEDAERMASELVVILRQLTPFLTERRAA